MLVGRIGLCVGFSVWLCVVGLVGIDSGLAGLLMWVASCWLLGCGFVVMCFWGLFKRSVGCVVLIVLFLLSLYVFCLCLFMVIYSIVVCLWLPLDTFWMDDCCLLWVLLLMLVLVGCFLRCWFDLLWFGCWGGRVMVFLIVWCGFGKYLIGSWWWGLYVGICYGMLFGLFDWCFRGVGLILWVGYFAHCDLLVAFLVLFGVLLALVVVRLVSFVLGADWLFVVGYVCAC